MERLTRQRKIILEELNKLKTHPTASDLYILVRKRIPNISLGTVYRNLEILSKEGKISKISCDSFSRFDGDLKRHEHFICKKCQKVFDYGKSIKIHFDKDLFEKETGFKVLTYKIDICGLCKNCRSKK